MNSNSPSPSRRSIAIVWRGDAAARKAATSQNNRFVRVFEALTSSGIDAQPAVYDEDFSDVVREQLLAVDGVLVWVDPIHQGKTRAALDQMLREVAMRGPWVSAHPDIILKMGVKDVLYRTRHLGWGADAPSLRQRRGLPLGVSVAGTGRRPSRDQAKSRQWRSRCLEGRSASRRPGSSAACAARKPSRAEFHWTPLWIAASRISAGVVVLSIKRFKRDCPRG